MKAVVVAVLVGMFVGAGLVGAGGYLFSGSFAGAAGARPGPWQAAIGPGPGGNGVVRINTLSGAMDVCGQAGGDWRGAWECEPLPAPARP